MIKFFESIGNAAANYVTEDGTSAFTKAFRLFQVVFYGYAAAFFVTLLLAAMLFAGAFDDEGCRDDQI